MTAPLRTVFRVQDAAGRGPFKPGFTAKWREPGFIRPPTWMEEFGETLLEVFGQPGEFFGSGVRTMAGLERWFSPAERARLAELGYRPVTLTGCRIIAESEHQVVFGRMRHTADGFQVRRWP